jgi:hypothetical protein
LTGGGVDEGEPHGTGAPELEGCGHGGGLVVGVMDAAVAQKGEARPDAVEEDLVVDRPNPPCKNCIFSRILAVIFAIVCIFEPFFYILKRWKIQDVFFLRL